MKHHPRQNVTLKIYSVSDDTASRLMTALGKLLHSRRFIGKAERWKMFRSTPPKSVGHQMTYADRVRFQEAYQASLEGRATAEHKAVLGQLTNFHAPGPFPYVLCGIATKDARAFKDFIRERTGEDYPLADAIRKVVRDDINRTAPVRTNAIAGQNTRGLR
jgi:hypothetical protein